MRPRRKRSTKSPHRHSTMSAMSTSSHSLRRWNVAACTLLALYLVSLIIFAVSIFNDHIGPIGLGAYTNEKAWWPILVQIALGAAAFATYYWPRRRYARNFSVLVTGVLAATTISLGLAAYWICESTAEERADSGLRSRLRST